MTRFVLIMLAGVFAVNMAFGKNASVAGDWLLTKVETKEGPQQPYLPVSFKENGDFELMGVKMGTWKLDKNAQTVTIVSQRFKEFDGNNKVLQLDKKVLVLENADIKMYFQHLDKEKIQKENRESGLVGTWQSVSADDPGVMTIVTFKTPDEFSYVKKEPGITTEGSGTWIFDQKAHTLILVARIEDLEKKYRVKNITATGFVLENNGKTLSWHKAETPAKIEHLTFQPDDFYDSDGNFKYEDEEGKLPWKETYTMIQYLQTIHQLTYKYSALVQGTRVFQDKTLTAGVRADENEGRACVDFIFYGYDKNHLPDDTQLPPNCITPDDNYNKLWPEKESDYRVAGKERITTPAGTFACTVIESVGSSDQRFKMWMIDDKPGVFARIIEENPDENFGYYHVFELMKIE